MADEIVKFRSRGETLVGVLTRPDGVKGDLPLVIMAGGWCYTKEVVMPHYAKFFHAIGVAKPSSTYVAFTRVLQSSLPPENEIVFVSTPIFRSIAVTLSVAAPTPGRFFAGGTVVNDPEQSFVSGAHGGETAMSFTPGPSTEYHHHLDISFP